MEESNKDVKQDLQPKADSNVNIAGTGKQQTPNNEAAKSPEQQNNVPESSKDAAADKSDSIDKDDELERLRKENERLKELQRLREENKRLSEGYTESQTRESKGKGKSNKIAIPIIAGAVAVVIVVVILIFGLHILSSTTVSSLKPSVNAGASGAFFLGPDGESLGSTYINGLSDLSSQLAQVGAQQVAGTFEYKAANTSVPSPGFYVLVYGNSSSNENYDIIPITVPSNFSNYSISSGGKPTFVYMGAQGCPYCAGMRWAIAITMSRFGNFTKLFYDRSATNDANVPTLMFNFSQSLFNQATSKSGISTIDGPAPYGDGYPEPLVAGAYYTSKYINFEPMDELGGSFIINTTGIGQISSTIYKNVYVVGMHGFASTRNAVTSADGFGIYDFFVGGVPFFDINNQYVFDGAIINAGTYYADTYLTNGGLNPAYETHADILNSIENPTGGSMGQTELGAANILTAQICSVINNTAPVCSLSYISGLESKIESLNYSGEY